MFKWKIFWFRGRNLMVLDKLNVCQSDTIAEGFHVPLATFAKLSENV